MAVYTQLFILVYEIIVNARTPVLLKDKLKLAVDTDVCHTEFVYDGIIQFAMPVHIVYQ